MNKKINNFKGKLGELLIEAKVITKKQLQVALEKQKEIGEKLGEVLISMDIITEEVLLNFLGEQCGLSAVDLSKYEELDNDIINSLPMSIVKRYSVMPIEKQENLLTIATSEPFNVFILDDIKLMTGFDIKMVIASEKKIREAINSYYAIKGTMGEIIDSIKDTDALDVEVLEEEEEEDPNTLASKAGDAPVIKLVNFMLTSAIDKGASDIHVEAGKNRVRLRFRIDGMLYEQPAPPKRIYSAIVSRIKIMGSLNIAEKRLPQDGSIKIKISSEKEIDFRVSIVPAQFGEKIVLRILNVGTLCTNLNSLGFEEHVLETYRKKIASPHGIILITGPTGSGKTTTLYSTLSVLNSPEKNIITIEDPVEYNLAGLTQVQTKSDIGLTFAEGLRTFLRQDPDIIMVGEIRDQETAKISINAALTGHLVLSTLHTNDAVSAVVRLSQMGVEPFLVSSTVLIVIAQRLVRIICPKCKEAYKVSKDDLKYLDISDEIFKGKDNITLYKGKGCADCSDTGYKGRAGCYEVLDVNNEIRELILRGASMMEIKKAARNNGMLTIKETALKKMFEGITTVEEIIRIAMMA